LRGKLEPHHAFMIGQHLALIDVFDEQIAAFDERIHEAIEGTRPLKSSKLTKIPFQVANPIPELRDIAEMLLDPGIGVDRIEIALAAVA
jgi:hypothetical protein